MGDTVDTPEQVQPTVARGSRVVLVVSRGPVPDVDLAALISVPNVVGESQGSALQRIEAAELNVQALTDYDPTVKRGHVVEQFPLPGNAIPRASDVVVLVSNGPAPTTEIVSLPSAIGLSEPEAIDRIRAASLEPVVARIHDANAIPGLVIAQLPSQPTISAEKPRSNTLRYVLLGIGFLAAIAVVVAVFTLLTGRTVSVPNLTGLDQQHAVAAINSAHLRLGSVTAQAGSDAPEGSVIAQSPAPGVDVRDGSPVALVVAAARPKVAVPALVGLSQADAIQAVAAAGLSAQIVQKYSDSIPQGSVIDQAPTSGSSAEKGSNVVVSISLGPKTTAATQPDLVGLAQSDATAKVVALGLVERVVTQYSSATAAGRVVAQFPAANQPIATGATVGISVSLGPAPTGAVTVPSLGGQSSANANSTLAAIGLNATLVQYDGSGQAADTVVSQLPQVGAQVPSGATLVVFVSTGR